LIEPNIVPGSPTQKELRSNLGFDEERVASHVKPEVGEEKEDGQGEQEAQQKLPCVRVLGLTFFLLEHMAGVLEDEVTPELFVFVLHMEHIMVLVLHHLDRLSSFSFSLENFLDKYDESDDNEISKKSKY
jgi:hypothetical protein